MSEQTLPLQTLSPEDLIDFLRFKTLHGFSRRGYPMTKEYLDRIEHELQIIHETKFASYFLIVADLCEHMRQEGIRYIVRGSGCGSVVVWGVGISHPWLDPIKYKLPFERFLNPSRVSNPDIDMDMADDRRSEMVAYAMAKYGDDRVAHIVTFGTLGAKAAIADIARAQGIPNYQEVAVSISSAIPGGKIKLADALLTSEFLRDKQKLYPDLFVMARRVEGKVRHASMHAAGIIIAPDALDKFVPSYFPPPEKRSGVEHAIQWDMYDAEARGLLKMDFLGLKTLRVMDETVAAINLIREQGQGLAPDFNLDLVARDDDKTWNLMAAGKLAGVFQVERTFVRNFARRMNLAEGRDPWKLATLISIIRPGMMDAGTTEIYLRRAAGLEVPTPIHPKLAETLKENFGLLVMQEDCMWVARDLAGFTMSEADNLRRAISKKKPKEMAKIKPSFLAGCVKHSAIPEQEALTVWEQMETFARYGFTAGHAAAYGLVILYQTAYLKANFPLIYMTSLINSENGVGDKERGYNAKVAEYVEEARSLGLQVLSPCIRRSTALCCIEWEDIKTWKGSIRFGLQMIKMVSAGAVEWIEEHTRQCTSFSEFMLCRHSLREVEVLKDGQPTGKKEWKATSEVGKREMENLILAGAFDIFDKDRDKLLAMLPTLLELTDKYWEQECKVRSGSKRLKITPDEVKKTIDGYRLEDHQVTHRAMETMLESERQITGCFLSHSPFTPYTQVIDAQTTCTAREIQEGDYLNPGKDTAVFVGMLSDLRTTIVKNGKSKGQEMAFMTFSGIGGTAEVTCFSRDWAKAKEIPGGVERGKVYLVRARPDRDGRGLLYCDLLCLTNRGFDPTGGH